MPSAIDPTKPVIVSPTTQSVRDNFQAAKDEIEALQTATTDLTFVGGLSAFAGDLVVNGLTQIDDAVTLTKAPGDSSIAVATTAYVDLALDVHEADADPHPGIYLTQVAADGLYDPLGAALQVDNSLTTHINAGDAHPIYLTVPEADGLYDVIGTANAVNNALLAHEADVSVHFADAPADGVSYSRQDNGWVAGGAGGGYVQQDVTPVAPLPDSGWWDTEDGEAFRYYDNAGNPVYVQEDPGAGSGGGMVPIESGSLTNIPELDIVLPISAFNNFILDIHKLIPATDDTDLAMRTSSDGGATFDAGASDYAWVQHGAGTVSVPFSVGASNVSLMQVGLNLSSLPPRNFGTRLHILGAAVATRATIINSLASNFAAIPELLVVVGAGHRTEANIVNAIQLILFSGNIAEVDYTLSGIRGA